MSMHALALDYQISRRKSNRPEIILLLSGLAATLFLGIHYLTVTTEMEQLESQQTTAASKTKHRVVDARLASLNAQQLRAEINQANVVLAQLALPWEALFRDIESSQRGRVALLSIEPNADKRTVKITGEAKDLAAMLSYLQFLQQKPSLHGVYLQSHHVDQQTAEKPVRFTLNASWVIKP
jgi:Tfp pilus assembly protein PilN